jgi:hypothetical protein
MDTNHKNHLFVSDGFQQFTHVVFVIVCFRYKIQIIEYQATKMGFRVQTEVQLPHGLVGVEHDIPKLQYH